MKIPSFSNFLFPLIFQFIKKDVWRSYNLRSRSAGGVSSIVIDASQGIPYSTSHEDNRFIYRFVPQDNSCPSMVSDDDPSSDSLKNDLDLTLRSGDYVVCIIFSLFLNCVNLVNSGIVLSGNELKGPWNGSIEDQTFV
jgi:hypothetical protein